MVAVKLLLELHKASPARLRQMALEEVYRRM